MDVAPEWHDFPSRNGQILAFLHEAEHRCRAADVGRRDAPMPVRDDSDQLIDKVLAQEQDLFIIASSVDEVFFARRDTPPRNTSRAPMRHAPNRSRTATAAVATTLRSARVARFPAARNAALPIPIPL